LQTSLGLVGLGKLGLGMARRLRRSGINVAGFDISHEATAAAGAAGIATWSSLAVLVDELKPPRAVWVMLPHGDVVDNVVEELTRLLDGGDIVLDGGNSDYRQSMRRAAVLKETGIDFIDVGTSGGVHGEEQGYCLMLGGDAAVISRLDPAFRALAPTPDRGWGHVGPTGAGHFVKMIHNGIEYGMMQALAEGLAIMRARKDFDLDLQQVTQIWESGSIIRSWLLEQVSEALRASSHLDGVAPHVSDTGMGRWTVREAIDLNVAAPVITASLLQRIRSRDTESFSDKALAAMRRQFGGHPVKPDDHVG